MQRILYILLTLLVLFYTGCSDHSEIYSDKTASVKLVLQSGVATKVIDEDNLLSEQTVKNISIFLTEPSSSVITSKYISTGFTDQGDYKLVTLPLEPSALQTKDVYVITNYDDMSLLKAVSSVEDIMALTTPVVGADNNLSPEKGITMYGASLNYDFTAANGAPAVVSVERACAKYRISVEFPESPTLSVDNSFFLKNMATYTSVVKNTSALIPSGSYYAYNTSLPLTFNGSVYTANAYVYEAALPPRIVLYSHMNNSKEAQAFETELPRPQRNYLYDIKVKIYSGDGSGSTKSGSVVPVKENNSYFYTITVHEQPPLVGAN